MFLFKKMISEVTSCKKCGSAGLVRNGSNAVGNPRYKCNSCGFSGVIKTRRYGETAQDLVLRAAQEWSSSRGLSRVFAISHQTALNWIKKSKSTPTLAPAKAGDVLELDAMISDEEYPFISLGKLIP